MSGLSIIINLMLELNHRIWNQKHQAKRTSK